jgi:hypothetical protein
MAEPVYTHRLSAENVAVATTLTPLVVGNVGYGRMFLRVRNDGLFPMDFIVLTSKDGARFQEWPGPTSELRHVAPDEQRETRIDQYRPYHMKIAARAHGGTTRAFIDLYQIPPEAP